LSQIRGLEDQTDARFIVTQKNYLMLLDQHAVDERIRIEKLLDRNFPNQENVIMSVLDTPILLELCQDDRMILKHFASKVKNFGLVILENDNEDFDEENALFYVNMAPSCFLQREASEKYFNRESPLENLLTELAKELAQTLKQTHGGLRLLPNTISNVLKSQACRGAIMFGDKLTLEECKQAINNLKGCHAPFQCAHGRPSVAPIVELTKLSMQPKMTVKQIDFSRNNVISF